MIALKVTLRVREGALEPFLAAITTNAARSIADEPGCRQFDIVQAHDDPHDFVLYERYDDLDAFAAHKAAPHFAVWREAAAAYLVPGSQLNTLGDVIAHHTDGQTADENR
ncbi:MAG: putative quinol monooxygenase [Tetrasphaera sp.]